MSDVLSEGYGKELVLEKKQYMDGGKGLENSVSYLISTHGYFKMFVSEPYTVQRYYRTWQING